MLVASARNDSKKNQAAPTKACAEKVHGGMNPPVRIQREPLESEMQIPRCPMNAIGALGMTVNN